jgi:hypothetical protein
MGGLTVHGPSGSCCFSIPKKACTVLKFIEINSQILTVKVHRMIGHPSMYHMPNVTVSHFHLPWVMVPAELF